MSKLFLFIIFIVLSINTYSQSYQSWITGDAADVTKTTQGGTLLMGGGADNDDAMRWMIARSGGGDIIVLRSTGDGAYNDYIFGLGTVNSVETIIVNSTTLANNAEIVQKVRNAEAVFISGGDQWEYISYWKNTQLEDAFNYLINTKHVVIGGTSAGCAIQGKCYYSAQNGTITSEQALANPYATTMTIGRDDFINNPFLTNTITDTHYNNPDRRGRQTTFLARMMKDWAVSPKGIAVNEATTVCIDENGLAKVFGSSSYDDYAYFLKVVGAGPETCVSGSPLTWNQNGTAVKVYKIKGNETGSNTFNLNDWTTGTGGTWVYFYAINGVFTEGTSVPPTPTYCVSKGTSATSEWIAKVVFGTINNQTGTNSGYADFTAQNTNVTQGQSYPITLTPGFSSSSYSEYWKVWIDYNNDKDFTDAGEEVYSGSGTSAVSGNITIPSTSTIGKTTMRVSMKYNAAPTACETFSYGEVEDYSVTIQSGTTVCNIPSGLSVTNLASTSATLSWLTTGAVSYTFRYKTVAGTTWTEVNASTALTYNLTGLTASTAYEFQVKSICSSGQSNYSVSTNFTTTSVATCNIPTGLSVTNLASTSATLNWLTTGAVSYTLRYKTIAATTWTEINAGTALTKNLTGLTAATTYEFQVKSICSSGQSNYSASTNFTTTSSVAYCTSKGNSVTNEWINRVKLNTIDKTSGANNGYADFTSLSTTLTKGTAYSIYVYPGYKATKYNEYIRIYIDYNKDGDFTDANELVYYNYTKDYIVGTVRPPTTALTGTTRMRVSMKYNAYATSCEIFSYGEVEDYTVNIVATKSGATEITENVENLQTSVYPNPGVDIINFEFESASNENAVIEIFDITGKLVQKFNEETVMGSNLITKDFSTFEKGLYICKITIGTESQILKFSLLN